MAPSFPRTEASTKPGAIHADLEADLGVDSVKQTELLARVAEQYALPPLPDDFRLADYTTLGRIADLVMATIPVAA
jgi:hypothetical protein